MLKMPCRRRPLSLALVATILAVGCTGAGTSPVSVAPTPASNATNAPLLPTTVDALPSMDVETFHRLMGQLEGTPVVVNVWGSWCVPCRGEAPMLTAAALSHPDIQFLGVDILDSRSDALRFLSDFGVPYPSVFDPPGAIKADLGAFGQPDTYFFDATGVRVAQVPGILSEASLDAGLAKIAPASESS